MPIAVALVSTLLALLVSLEIGPTRFDDAALERLLRERQRVVVCIWSPHMPLSIDAVHQVTLAARALDVGVVVVLDPRADRAYAATAAVAARLPLEALQAAHALKLLQADAFQHSPAIVAFADGQQAGPPIFGFRTASDYEQAIRQRFERR